MQFCESGGCGCVVVRPERNTRTLLVTLTPFPGTEVYLASLSGLSIPSFHPWCYSVMVVLGVVIVVIESLFLFLKGGH